MWGCFYSSGMDQEFMFLPAGADHFNKVYSHPPQVVPHCLSSYPPPPPQPFFWVFKRKSWREGSFEWKVSCKLFLPSSGFVFLWSIKIQFPFQWHKWIYPKLRGLRSSSRTGARWDLDLMEQIGLSEYATWEMWWGSRAKTRSNWTLSGANFADWAQLCGRVFFFEDRGCF